MTTPVYDNVRELLGSEKIAKTIVEKALKFHEGNSINKEADSIKRKIYDYERHEAALAQRLAELPTNISAAPIYKQMEQLQKAREQLQTGLMEFNATRGNISQIPIKLADYRAFLEVIQESFERETSAEWRSQLLKRLIQKIEVGTDKIRIHYYIGQNLAQIGEKTTKKPKKNNFLGVPGSNTLTNGGPSRT